MQHTAPPATVAPDDDVAEVEPLRRKKKRKRKGAGFFAYYGSFLAGYASGKNIATVIFLLIGIWIVGIGWWFMEKGGGLMSTPMLLSGFGLIVLTLAMRFVFYAD
jgi:hypothetical protein